MKKIAFILPNLLAGGTQKVIIDLANGVNSEKYEVFLIVINKLDTSYKNKRGDEQNLFKRIDQKTVKYINLNRNGVKWSALKLRRILNEIKPNIVFSSLSYVNLYIAIFKFIFPKNIIYVARESNTLSVKNHHLKIPTYVNKIYRIFYKNFDKIICQSNDMKNDLAENFLIPEKKLVTINNPVNIRLGQSKDAKPLFLDPAFKHIICVGHLSYQKGHDLLVDALGRLKSKDWHCHLIGRDSGMKKVIDASLENKPNISEKIFIHGFKSNPFDYLGRADLFVLASRFEGFPNVLLEAGVLGLPLIAFDNPGGMAEIINSDEIGFLAESNNVDDLAAKIDTALKNNYKKEKIVKSISGRYNIKTIIAKYELEFESMI